MAGGREIFEFFFGHGFCHVLGGALQGGNLGLAPLGRERSTGSHLLGFGFGGHDPFLCAGTAPQGTCDENAQLRFLFQIEAGPGTFPCLPH